MVVVEFTIEPFVDGHPGPHVAAAVDAARALGAEVDFGPFGSTCVVDVDTAATLTSSVVAAALANGASHINLHIERRSDE